eukprot:5839324-Ditylum_brightwellii.AAC.1
MHRYEFKTNNHAAELVLQVHFSGQNNSSAILNGSEANAWHSHSRNVTVATATNSNSNSNLVLPALEDLDESDDE